METARGCNTWINFGQRSDTGVPLATTHRSESLRDVVRDVVREETSVLEDAIVHLQVQLQQAQTRLDDLEKVNNVSAGQLLDLAYAEIVRGQLNVLNDGTKAHIAALDPWGRAALERQLDRPLQEDEDFYTLSKTPDALLRDGRPIDQALCAGHDKLGQKYQAAINELSWRGEGQIFPSMLQPNTLRRAVGGPVSRLLFSCNDIGHPLERGRQRDVEALLGHMPLKIAQGHPMYTKGPEMNQMLVVGATMGQACMQKFGHFSITKYRDLDQPTRYQQSD